MAISRGVTPASGPDEARAGEGGSPWAEVMPRPAAVVATVVAPRSVASRTKTLVEESASAWVSDKGPASES